MLNQSRLGALPMEVILHTFGEGNGRPAVLPPGERGNYELIETQLKRLWGICGYLPKTALLRSLMAIQLSGASECEL